MPPQRVMFNLPRNVGALPVVDRLALVDCVPRIGDTITLDQVAYVVHKVLHTVNVFGSVTRARMPVIYLASERALTPSEEHYAKEMSL